MSETPRNDDPADNERFGDPTAPSGEPNDDVTWSAPSTSGQSNRPTEPLPGGGEPSTPAQDPYAPPPAAGPNPYAPPSTAQNPYAAPAGESPYATSSTGQNPYAAPPGGEYPYAAQPPYPPAPYGQPYGAAGGMNPYAVPGRGSNGSAIALTVVSGVLFLLSCGAAFLAAVPGLVFGILGLTKHSTDPVGAARLTRIGWIVFAAGLLVSLLGLAALLAFGLSERSSFGAGV